MFVFPTFSFGRCRFCGPLHRSGSCKRYSGNWFRSLHFRFSYFCSDLSLRTEWHFDQLLLKKSLGLSCLEGILVLLLVSFCSCSSGLRNNFIIFNIFNYQFSPFNYKHKTLLYIYNFGSVHFFDSLFTFELFDHIHISLSFHLLYSNYSRFHSFGIFNSLFGFYFWDNDRLNFIHFEHFHKFICDDKILRVHFFEFAIVVLRFDIIKTL